MDMYDILLARSLGSGGSGTTNYNALSNKPQINGHTLQGDSSTSDLGLGTAAEKDYTTTVEDGSADLPTGDAVHDFVAAQVANIDNSIDDIQGQIDTVRDIVNTELYGFKIDKQDSNPATRVTYLYDAVGKTPAHMDYTGGAFDYGDWADAWFIRENKPCALRYNGTVAYYLNPNDYTKKADGTASDVSDGSFEGNFMAQLPAIWVKRWEDENYLYTAISNRQIDSSFKAYAHDAGDGYVNDYIYLPMFKGYVVDSKLRSIAGVSPQGSTTGSYENTAAEACGAGWQIWDWSKHEVLSDLLTLISCSTDSQASFGQGDSRTYDSTDENYGKLTTGTSGAGQFWGANDELHHVKVFHVEDFWGNRWDRCLGLNLVYGVYVYKPARPYALSPDSSYISTGISSPEAGWQKEQYVGEFGTLVKTTDGSETTYACDYFWATGTGKLALFGATCNGGTRCGSRCFNLKDAPNSSNWGVGASVVYNAPHSGYDDKVDEEVFDYVQPQIDTIREILGVELYGFRIDKQDSNPATRVTYMYDAAGKAPAHMDYTSGAFDYGDWANAWFVRENKPCALKYDGTVDYYLNPNDYTKKADGTASDVSDSSYAGNFMATIPTIWVKRWEDTRYIYVAVSNKQINDSYKAYAHDAGDGHINDVIYLPMFKGSVIDSKLRSIAGVYPDNFTNVTQQSTAAAACGSGWQLWDWSKHCLIADLLTLISASTDSQYSFGAGVINTYDTEDAHYGMKAAGIDDLTTGQFYGASGMTSHVKCFHIEDLWGNRTESCLGLNFIDYKYSYKLTRPYANAPDASYTSTNITPPETGYTTQMWVGDYGFLPKGTSGSDTTYYCDYATAPSTAENRIASIGGNCQSTTGAGMYYVSPIIPSYTQYKVCGASPVYNATHST